MKPRPAFFAAATAAALAAAVAPAESQSPAPLPDAALTYADLADLSVTAPIAAHVRVVRAIALKEKQAPGVGPGQSRLFVEADVVSLIRSTEGLPSRLRYVVDLPHSAKGKAPKIAKGSQFILLAAPVPGRPGEIRLIAPDAQIAWTPQRGEQLRSLLREVTGPRPAPRITGIGRAFHVPGAIPGESETQIFLQTAAGDPVSLSILRRPGETPYWSVALSEIVDDAAQPPKRDTLLWYRLACALPRALPRHSLADADSAAARAIRGDYALVLERLGPCVRSRTRG